VFNAEYAAKKAAVESLIAELGAELNAVPEPLLSSIKYSLTGGGKRLRPVLTLEFFDMFARIGGGAAGAAIPRAAAERFALAIECAHVYSLIHDDLPSMDNDDFRRGKPTNHRVFGEGIAVLAGDALLNLAYELFFQAVKTGGAAAVAAADGAARLLGARGLIGGQALDISPGAAKKPDSIYLHKTGDLIAAAAEGGARLGGADENSLARVREFSYAFGMAFQIRDDLLDRGESGKPNKSVKPGAADYVSVYGAEKADAALCEYTKKAVAALEKIETACGADAGFIKSLTLGAAARAV
jgi:geranylgeranyl diphosphate synthase type II